MNDQEAKAIMDKIIDYNFSLIKAKMRAKGISFEEAKAEWFAEIVEEGKDSARPLV